MKNEPRPIFTIPHGLWRYVIRESFAVTHSSNFSIFRSVPMFARWKNTKRYKTTFFPQKRKTKIFILSVRKHTRLSVGKKRSNNTCSCRNELSASVFMLNKILFLSRCFSRFFFVGRDL